VQSEYIWNKLNWHGLVFVWTDQWTNKTSLLIIGWCIRDNSHVSPTPLDGAYCNALLIALWFMTSKFNWILEVDEYKFAQTFIKLILLQQFIRLWWQRNIQTRNKLAKRRETILSSPMRRANIMLLSTLFEELCFWKSVQQMAVDCVYRRNCTVHRHCSP